ncbi:hypothetical protein N7492_007989 [Penicillium capsulatum]|uniref:Uncharacterized protein n=1 Tax=Penicillium capsulatum TaxID=69766 RepID=A0A9W9LFJ7_9EURO|nr:hypothetical protein N7492_007989 [Penicillium capsulatum]
MPADEKERASVAAAFAIKWATAPRPPASASTSAVPADEKERASAAAAFASMWRTRSQPPASASTSAGPREADSWVKMIRKGNDCHVQYSLQKNWLHGTSPKIGTYDPKSKRCIYTGKASQDLDDPKRKTTRAEFAYNAIYSRTMLGLQVYQHDKPIFFVDFPLPHQPGCHAWATTNNAELKLLRYWADSRCHFDPSEWRDSFPGTSLSGWPHALDNKDVGSDVSFPKRIRAEPVDINHLPAGLSSKGPPEYQIKPSKKNFWIGLYRKGEECRIWLHNAFGNGADLSVPSGTFNAKTHKCESSNGPDTRRQIEKVGDFQFVTYYFEDDRSWSQARGSVVVTNGTVDSSMATFYPLGVGVGCQMFRQSSPDGEDHQQWVTKNCATNLKKDFAFKEWDPKEITDGKSD